VVDLVLGVRALRIRSSGGQHVDADGQVVGADELVIETAGRGELLAQRIELEGVHGSAA